MHGKFIELFVNIDHLTEHMCMENMYYYIMSRVWPQQIWTSLIRHCKMGMVCPRCQGAQDKQIYLLFILKIKSNVYCVLQTRW